MCTHSQDNGKAKTTQFMSSVTLSDLVKMSFFLLFLNHKNSGKLTNLTVRSTGHLMVKVGSQKLLKYFK